MITLWRNARLVTLAGPAGWGDIAGGAMLSEGDTLRWAGPAAERPPTPHPDREIDLGGALVTPGLVD